MKDEELRIGMIVDVTGGPLIFEGVVAGHKKYMSINSTDVIEHRWFVCGYWYHADQLETTHHYLHSTSQEGIR